MESRVIQTQTPLTQQAKYQATHQKSHLNNARAKGGLQEIL